MISPERDVQSGSRATTWLRIKNKTMKQIQASGTPLMSFNTLIRVCGGFPLADTSALAAIHRALRGCCTRSRYPEYFVKVHKRCHSC